MSHCGFWCQSGRPAASKDGEQRRIFTIATRQESFSLPPIDANYFHCHCQESSVKCFFVSFGEWVICKLADIEISTEKIILSCLLCLKIGISCLMFKSKAVRCNPNSVRPLHKLFKGFAVLSALESWKPIQLMPKFYNHCCLPWSYFFGKE